MTLAVSCESANLNPMSFTDQHGAVLLERMRYQRETGRFCDVVIRVHDRQFAAHRNVLASCSPYFDSILKTNLVIKEQVTVNCPNAAAFELLLNYMYSGSVVIDRSTVADLLKLANNFLILKVKNYCAEYLDRNLDAANVLSVRQLAAKYNLPLLFKAAVEFFDMNINRCLLESVDILEYSVSQVQKIIEDPKYCNLISPDVHLKTVARWASEDMGRRARDFRILLASCQVRQLTQAAVHFVLDYSPLMNKHQPSRFALLQALHDAGFNLGKYSEQYAQMVEMGVESCLIAVVREEEGSELGDEMSTDEVDESPLQGHPPTATILSERKMPFLAAPEEESVGGGIKLRIQLGNSKMTREEKERRKLVKHMKKQRRWRQSEGIGSSTWREGEAAQFDEDEVDGVYGDELRDAIVYGESDGLDPALVDDLDEEENEPEGQFICPHCKFATNENEDFHKHMARRHNRNTIWVCPLCPFQCGWSSSFYEHVAIHFPGAPPFRCDHCEVVIEGPLHELLNHRLLHTTDRPFKCASCGWAGRSRSQLWDHERVHSGLCAVACADCGRSFRVERALERHRETHSDLRPHCCAECGWTTREEGDLLAHRSLSHQLDVYNCHITGCDYVSTKKSQLAAHLRTHLAVRAHLCKICGRSFIEKSHVVRHERIHLEEKPFKCEQCEYASSRRDKLKEHILKHHNGEGGKVQRRRYKRAKQLAAAVASQAKPPLESVFLPVDVVVGERVEQWPHLWHTRAASVVPSLVSAPPVSPGTMSLMNVNVRGGETPLLSKEVVEGDVAMQESALVTPVPRSPHNYSDPFALSSSDSHRPSSLPPYGGLHWT